MEKQNVLQVERMVTAVKAGLDVYDGHAITVDELVAEIGIGKTSVFANMIKPFDGLHPGEGSEFPNAYKIGKQGETSPVLIPIADVLAYKARRVAGLDAPKRDGDGVVNSFGDLTVAQVIDNVERFDNFYTFKQALEVLGIGKTVLYDKLRSGEIKAYKPGGATSGYRIPVAEIAQEATAQ